MFLVIEFFIVLKETWSFIIVLWSIQMKGCVSVYEKENLPHTFPKLSPG